MMKSCGRIALRVAVGIISFVFPATRGYALINPRFTPVHLTEQSELIVEVVLRPGTAKDSCMAVVKKVLKGDAKRNGLTFDLSSALNRQHAEALTGLAAAAKSQPALFFAGEYLEDAPAGGGAPPGGGSGFADPFGRGAAPKKSATRKGLLHIGGLWAEFQGSDDGVWSLTQIDLHMQAVWAGGTDMLGRCVRYILEDDDPEVPVNAGAAWIEQPTLFGPVGGKIAALAAVELGDHDRPLLYVAADSGDRLLICDPDSLELKDVTAARQLGSKSRVFAWGDFSGDGRLDLVSYNGNQIGLQRQQADGTFAPQSLDLGDLLEKGCVGLAALDVGHKTHCGLLVSTIASPVLVTFRANAPPTVTTLSGHEFDSSGSRSRETSGPEPSRVRLQTPVGGNSEGGFELDRLGQPGACIVADFDGDALPDVLQPFANGSVFFKGLDLGKFQAAASCRVQLGQGRADACVTDFDGDGRLDVFCVAEDTSRIWQNEGGGMFSEHFGASGEIAYISKPGGVDCAVGDVNNDGRQDTLIVYKSMGPQIFFNRGFRSFGHAHMLDLAENRLLPEADTGQQAGCLADFDGDGAQDMALALNNGRVCVFYNENEYGEACSLTASLPTNAVGKGPVTVTGWFYKRCLGSWNVAAGTGPAFFGLSEPGPVTVKWTLPGRKPVEKEIIVENKPVRLEIE